ncbi:MAG: hypothetical protein WC694_03135 [Candidatus Paceibacterota bacterium]|jgi:hypothetical protein
METVNQNSFLQNTFIDSKYFNPEYLFNQGSIFFHDLFSFLSEVPIDQVIIFIKTILFFLAMFFLTIICYVIVRMLEIRAKEHKYTHDEIHEYAHKKEQEEKKKREESRGSKNERWVKTLSYLFSQHASDWKLSIIEADSMLESLMEQLGFRGETLGDRLKMANQENFPNLTIAWEVHTIRNRIAHEGLNFEVSQHEAKRVIALYEQIFHEYGYI